MSTWAVVLDVMRPTGSPLMMMTLVVSVSVSNIPSEALYWVTLKVALYSPGSQNLLVHIPVWVEFQS